MSFGVLRRMLIGLVQHCHGAPGIVNCFAVFPDRGIDDLLIGAGELIWQAGPPRKGPMPRHGGKWLRVSETLPALG
jgi:hypothetical protein